jgi:hypothetical protein
MCLMKLLFLVHSNESRPQTERGEKFKISNRRSMPAGGPTLLHSDTKNNCRSGPCEGNIVARTMCVESLF